MTGFSDPAWWPKPPPRPPAHVSLPKILLGGLVPVGLVAAVVVLVVSQRHHGPAAVRSVAAYESCLDSHLGHAGAAGGPVGPRGAPSEALRDCQPLLPSGVAVGSLAPTSQAASAAEAQFQSCVRNAIAGLPRHAGAFGRFGGGRSSSAVRAAISVCQTLVAGGAGQSGGGGSSTGGSSGSAGSGPRARAGGAGSAPKM